MKHRDWRPLRLGFVDLDGKFGGREKDWRRGCAEVEMVLLLCMEWVWWVVGVKEVEVRVQRM